MWEFECLVFKLIFFVPFVSWKFCKILLSLFHFSPFAMQLHNKELKLGMYAGKLTLYYIFLLIMSLYSEDDFCLGSWNVDHNQQFFQNFSHLDNHIICITCSFWAFLLIPVTGFLISVNIWNKTSSSSPFAPACCA